MSRSKKLTHTTAHETMTFTDQGDEPTCLYHTIARCFYHNVFKLLIKLSPHWSMYLNTTERENFYNILPRDIPLPPSPDPRSDPATRFDDNNEYNQFLKVCMFYYVYCITEKYYEEKQKPPSLTLHTPEIVELVKEYIRDKKMPDQLEKSPHHCRAILDFLSNSGIQQDVKFINVTRPTSLGSIREFGEEVIDKYKGEYFAVHVGTQGLDTYSKDSLHIGHAMVISHYDKRTKVFGLLDDSTIRVSNSWNDGSYPVKLNMLEIGYWGQYPSPQKWGFCEFFVYIGYRQIRYRGVDTDLTPYDIFLRRKTQLTALKTLTVAAACAALLYMYTHGVSFGRGIKRTRVKKNKRLKYATKNKQHTTTIKKYTPFA